MPSIPTSEPVEHVSRTWDRPDNQLTCKCVGQRAVSTALIETLSQLYEGGRSAAPRQRLGTTMQTSCLIEDRARETTELVDDARMINIGVSGLNAGMTQATKIAWAAARAMHHSPSLLLFRLLSTTSGLPLMTAVNSDLQRPQAGSVIASHFDRIWGGVMRLGEAMRAHLDTKGDHPHPRQGSTAGAGAE